MHHERCPCRKTKVNKETDEMQDLIACWWHQMQTNTAPWMRWVLIIVTYGAKSPATKRITASFTLRQLLGMGITMQKTYKRDTEEEQLKYQAGCLMLTRIYSRISTMEIYIIHKDSTTSDLIHKIWNTLFLSKATYGLHRWNKVKRELKMHGLYWKQNWQNWNFDGNCQT